MLTLGQLHAELAGKLQANKEEAERLRASMKHVEAAMKLLEPDYSLRPIAIRRRKANRSRRARSLWGWWPQGGVRSQNLTGSVNSSLKNYKGKGTVTNDGTIPAWWRLAPWLEPLGLPNTHSCDGVAVMPHRLLRHCKKITFHGPCGAADLHHS